MKKKGDIWVSAVLYIALGMIAITVILAAGLPLIQKMKDRNTVAQTKELMLVLDETIRRVASEGPGAQRQLSPFVVKQGQLFIDEADAAGKGSNVIKWVSETSALVMEPGIDKKEGNLIVRLEETHVADVYQIQLKLDYTDFLDIQLKSDFGNPFSGEFSLLVKNSGKFGDNDLPVVEIIVS